MLLDGFGEVHLSEIIKGFIEYSCQNAHLTDSRLDFRQIVIAASYF